MSELVREGFEVLDPAPRLLKYLMSPQVEETRRRAGYCLVYCPMVESDSLRLPSYFVALREFWMERISVIDRPV